MFSSTPRRVRCLTLSVTDCIPASSDSLRGAESAKLAARLALTGRYRSHLPQSSDEKLSRERISDHEDDAECKARRGLPDFRLHPPEPSLLTCAIRLLENCSSLAKACKVSHHTALMHVLDQEESTAGLEGLTRHQSRELHTRVRELRQLVQHLNLQSSMSCQLGMECAGARDRHMLEETRVCYRLPSKQPREIIDQAIFDADAIVTSKDFLPLYFGDGVGPRHSRGSQGWLEQQLQQLEQERDRDLLMLRMLLDSEPFIVRCTGADHMGAFLRLAKWKRLHLQLLPSRSHVDNVMK